MLTFLIQQAAKVYALFGYLWDKVKSAALNAYNWAVSKAAGALLAAKDFALEQLGKAYAYANGRIDWLKSLILGWIEAVKALALSWVEAAKAALGLDISEAKRSSEKNLDVSKSFTMAEVGKLASRVEIENQLTRSNLAKTTAQVMTWKQLIDSLLALLTVENLKRLGMLLVNFFPMLLALVASPLSWIFSTISGGFVTFFCYTLARAMGTTVYTLPPPPDWLSGAGGMFSPGPPGPDPSGGELAPPLSSLYVSGYRFGPGHPGIDLGLARGAPVYAMHDGEVEVATKSTVGYGLTITLRNGKWWTRYAHLDSLGVAKGDKVKQRQKIGEGNSTGKSTGDHLHLEIKLNGVFVDPASILF
jgi:murein DD-endopeptidase MepM/ murein hydrolase activator NlpD